MSDFVTLFFMCLWWMLGLWKLCELLFAILDRLIFGPQPKGKVHAKILLINRKPPACIADDSPDDPPSELDREAELLRDPDAWKNQ